MQQQLTMQGTVESVNTTPGQTGKVVTLRPRPDIAAVQGGSTIDLRLHNDYAANIESGQEFDLDLRFSPSKR